MTFSSLKFAKSIYFLLILSLVFVLSGCTTEAEKQYGLKHDCRPENGICYYDLPDNVAYSQRKEVKKFIASETSQQKYLQCDQMQSSSNIIAAEDIPQGDMTGGSWYSYIRVCGQDYYILKEFPSLGGEYELYGPFALGS